MAHDELTNSIRAIGREFAARHGNDVKRMANELRRQQAESGRKAVRYAIRQNEPMKVDTVVEQKNLAPK